MMILMMMPLPLNLNRMSDYVRGGIVGPHSKDARDYRKLLRAIVDTPVLEGMAAGLEIGVETLGALQAGRTKAIQNLEKVLSGPGRERLAEFFAELAGSHEKRFIQAHRRALGIDMMGLLSSPPVKGAMAKATNENVHLIRLIAKKHLPKVFLQVQEIYGREPFSRKALADLFASQWQYSDYPLRRIARDQVNKQIGSLNEIRQTQLGITEYEWQTSKDNRVRETHQANDGRRFKWGSPPSDTGHPGHDIQCRCVAIALIPNS